MYSYKDMELMTENATLKERCTQLQFQVKLYQEMISILSKDKVTVPPMINPSPFSQGCSRCGIGADGKPMGYACTRADCPTGVTC